MTAKPKPEAKLTDAERHAPVVEMAREVEGEETDEAAERAFRRVVMAPKRKPAAPS